MNIRKENDFDLNEIWAVNVDAFSREAEADLVNVLRDNAKLVISLVAEINEKVVGYILFAPVELIGSTKPLKIMGLAPLAVLSDYQNIGIGSQLVRAGIEQCKLQGYHAIVVLGHSAYYPKFGFVPAIQYSIKSEYSVSDEKFMVLELEAGLLASNGGLIKYHRAFSDL